MALGAPCDVSSHAKQIQIDVVFIHFLRSIFNVDVRHEVTIAVVACASVAPRPVRLLDIATVWKLRRIWRLIAVRTQALNHVESRAGIPADSSTSYCAT
jgi:hypothetical protein